MLKRLDQLLAGVPLHPFLFASYVVLQLYVNNLAEVPPADVVPVLVVVLALTAVLLGLAWLGYRDLLRAAVLVAVTMMLLLGFGHVRAALMPLGFTHGVLMLVVALLLVLLVAFAAARIGSSLAPLTQALNLVSVVLLVVAIIPVGAFARDALRVPADLALEAQPAIDIDLAAVDETAPARDIYYLVLDRYGSEQALGMGHGLDNSEFSEWLREQGFDVVDGARANYVRSTTSSPVPAARAAPTGRSSNASARAVPRPSSRFRATGTSTSARGSTRHANPTSPM